MAYIFPKTFGTTAGNYTLGGALLFLIITLSISFSSNTWKRASLNSQITGTASDIRSSGLQQGDKGTTVTRLNPVGKVLINDQIYEARSEEGFVDQQKEITVHKVLNTQLIVKQIKK